MKKRLTSFLLVLALSFSLSLSAFAVDDSNYYALPPVGSDPSLAMGRPVALAVSHDGFLAEDSNNLARIMTDLTTTGLTTLKSYVLDIRDSLYRGGSVFGFLSDITNALTAQSVRGTLAWYIKQMDSSLASIDSSITAAFGDQGMATETTLSSFFSYFSDSKFVDSPHSSLVGFNGLLGKVFDMRRHLNYLNFDDFPYQFPYYDPVNNSYGYYNYSFADVLGHLTGSLMADQQFYSAGVGWTLYHYVKNLSEFLASDDDKLLAQNQKDNREQIEQDFLNGKSDKTSLGKGDFNNASQVGGALSDTFNMGGASKVSDFLSGFGSAGEESLSWFSDTTANNLDGVTVSGNSTSGVSTFADDGETMVDVDSDPYNMAEIFDRYEWLEGVFG